MTGEALDRHIAAELVNKTDWGPYLEEELSEPYWQNLQTFVAKERSCGTVYPEAGEVFAALHLTGYADVRCVILGQDPYHGPGQAHGLSFSVPPGVAIPPSLRNIYKELHNDLGIEPAEHGNLTKWANGGVLLLNSVLSVGAGEAASHRKAGWQNFTDKVITVTAEKDKPVAFILWGNYARSKKPLIETVEGPNLVIESPHPSPLSASRGFFGSKPFSAVNKFLIATDQPAIDWSLN